MSNGRSKRVRLRRGDLFELVAADGRLGYGVVLKPGGVLDVFFLKDLHPARPAATSLCASEVALIGTTQDAFFFHGRWTVIGHDFPIPADLPFQNWKVGIDGELHTTNFAGDRYRPMLSGERELLEYKFSAAPIAFQRALEALNGVGEWRDDYEKLTLAYARRRVVGL